QLGEVSLEARPVDLAHVEVMFLVTDGRHYELIEQRGRSTSPWSQQAHASSREPSIHLVDERPATDELASKRWCAHAQRQRPRTSSPAESCAIRCCVLLQAGSP